MTMTLAKPRAATTMDGWLSGPESWARALWAWLLRHSRRPPRSLRLCESLSLGDRRFVAVVQYQEARFLVGGTAASLVMLARLDNDREDSIESETMAELAVGPAADGKERRC